MAWDEEGNLLPRMASELIKDLQQLIDTEGDLPVWVEIEWMGYEYSESRNGPLSDAPTVKPLTEIFQASTWWGGRFEKAILLEIYV